MNVEPTTHPIAWFRDRSIDGSLALKPPYQRKPVWTKNQRAYLIDSILKGYHLPEVYVHRVTDLKGKTIYNIVDGQQRIRAILDFVNDKYSLSEDETPEYGDQNFSDLPESIKTDFWGKSIYVREISNASDEEVRELFKRMNKNVVALNSQELRHATYSGDFITLMEELSDDPFWTENKVVGPTEVRRMNDVQYISELFVSMINGVQDKSKDLEKFYEVYEEDFPSKAEWKDKFLAVKQFIAEILPNLGETRWKNKPDLYTLFMVLNNILGKKKAFTISATKKDQLSKKLNDFSSEVASAVTIKGSLNKSAKDVRAYANTVIKATSDKNTRIAREKILAKLISSFFSN